MERMVFRWVAAQATGDLRCAGPEMQNGAGLPPRRDDQMRAEAREGQSFSISSGTAVNRSATSP